MPAGRPHKYKDIDDLQERIDSFFAQCDELDKPYTITGLALHLGTTRDLLCDYVAHPDRYGQEFSDAIKIAKQRCENYAENLLLSGKNPTGAIFALKNYGWRDKQETEITGETDLNINVSFVTSDKDD